MGYISIGWNIDPEDWKQPPAEEIVRRVIKTPRKTNATSSCCTMREGTAVRRSRHCRSSSIGSARCGYELVSVSRLMGRSRDDVMPPLSADKEVSAAVNRQTFHLMYGCLENPLGTLPGRCRAGHRAAGFHRGGRRHRQTSAANDHGGTGIPAGSGGDRSGLQRRESHRQHDRLPLGHPLSRNDGDSGGGRRLSRQDRRVRAGRLRGRAASPHFLTSPTAESRRRSISACGGPPPRSSSASTPTRSFPAKPSTGWCGTLPILAWARWPAMPKSATASTCSRGGKHWNTSRARTSIAAPSTCSTASPWFPEQSVPGGENWSRSWAALLRTRWPRMPT